MTKNRYLFQKRLAYIIAIISLSAFIQAQSCSPGMFTRQGQVDSFKINYPGCTKINGNLTITNNVANLDSMYEIKKVNGALNINNSKLVDLNGLQNMESANNLTIVNNMILTNLQGINDIEYVGFIYLAENKSLEDISAISQTNYSGVLIVNCWKLKKIVGFNGAKTLSASIIILDNFDVDTIDAFHNVDSINGRLRIDGHHKLKSLSMGEKLKYIRDDLVITNSPLLPILPEFPLLDNIRSLKLENLHGLQQISSFPVLSQARQDVLIQLNDKLDDISGFKKLTHIGRDLVIRQLPELSEISGFKTLALVDRSISFDQLNKLKNLNSFATLNQTDSIAIRTCQSLDDISGITKLDFSKLNYLGLAGNESLSYCHYFPLCQYLQENRGRHNISSNKAGCNTADEIKETCRTVSADDELVIRITLSPNPTESDFLLTISGYVPSDGTLDIYDMMGRAVHQQPIYYGINQVDIAKFHVGTYLYQVSDGIKTLKRGKLVRI
ncbi:MAG: T9SS type A sorting domain-containing protein [Saprospiraceae bacterium]|nr:T9SS type A sorting domain-containing protein [Saprospiraceae bacterium]